MKLDKAILAEALIRGAQGDEADNKQRAQTITADESFKQYIQRALREKRDTRGLAASFGTMFDIGLEAGMLYRDIEKEKEEKAAVV